MSRNTDCEHRHVGLSAKILQELCCFSHKIRAWVLSGHVARPAPSASEVAHPETDQESDSHAYAEAPEPLRVRPRQSPCSLCVKREGDTRQDRPITCSVNGESAQTCVYVILGHIEEISSPISEMADFSVGWPVSVSFSESSVDFLPPPNNEAIFACASAETTTASRRGRPGAGEDWLLFGCRFTVWVPACLGLAGRTGAEMQRQQRGHDRDPEIPLATPVEPGPPNYF